MKNLIIFLNYKEEKFFELAFLMIAKLFILYYLIVFFVLKLKTNNKTLKILDNFNFYY